MDWLRQVPIGQYVEGGKSWLRLLDPRMKFAWVLMFLGTPILANITWRLSLVVSLFLITCLSSLPLRIWWRSVLFLLIFSGLLGLLALFLPIGPTPGTFAIRSPYELPGVNLFGPSWESFRLGPFNFIFFKLGPFLFKKGSVDLALSTSTLIFTVIHSVNLMLLSTPPEDLVWAISWFLSPLKIFGLPIERLSFELLLALRFLPLVQEELQNLLRSLASRAVDLRRLGLKSSIGLILSVSERLLANILLRAEQGADALIARGVILLPADQLRIKSFLNRTSVSINVISLILLLFVLGLRQQYGDL